MLLVISVPRVPPKVGISVFGANCSWASHTSSMSRQRCTKASVCAKMDVTSKSHDLAERALTAAAVAWYTRFQASPARMLSRRPVMHSFTSPSKISSREIFLQQRLMISLLTFRRRPARRSSVL